MDKPEIFILFPIYEDASDVPHYISKIELKQDSYYIECIKVVNNILDVFSIENYNGYYDSENINAFLYPFDIVEDYYPNIRSQFRILMSRWGENWRNDSKQEEADSFYYFSTQIKNDTFCEATKRKSINYENNFLIINYDAFSSDKGDKVLINYKNRDYHIDVVSPDIKKIALWFSLNRQPKRIYNFNPKHGENGKRAFSSNKGDKVSILMCGKDDVTDMLNMAFGEDSKVLYYYDCKYKRYIEFKRELEQKDKIVYHAFHLDCSNEKRIPQKVKSVINDCFRK